MLQRLSSHAYKTYAERYRARLYPSLQLGDVPMALCPSLQSSPLVSRQPGIAPADRDMYGGAPSQVAPLHTAAPSASIIAKAMPCVVALRDSVASVGTSESYPAQTE
jgi:hypothetical protein